MSARHKTATNRAANVYDVASYSNRHTKRGNLYESKKPNFLSRKWRRTITRRVAISNQLLNQVVVVVVLLLVGRSSSEKHRAPSSQIGLRRNLAEMFIKAVRSPKRCKVGPRLLLRTNIKLLWLFFFLLVDRHQKSLGLRRLKSDWDEIWQKCS